MFSVGVISLHYTPLIPVSMFGYYFSDDMSSEEGSSARKVDSGLELTSGSSVLYNTTKAVRPTSVSQSLVGVPCNLKILKSSKS